MNTFLTNIPVFNPRETSKNYTNELMRLLEGRELDSPFYSLFTERPPISIFYDPSPCVISN